MSLAANGIKCIGNVEVIADGSGHAGDLTVDGTLGALTQVTSADIVQAARLKLTSNPASTADLGANFLHALTIPKAWGLLISDGVGGVAVADGAGIASVALAGSNRGWTVTLSHAMASTNYAVVAVYAVVAGGNSTNAFTAKFKPSSVTGFDVLLQKTTDESYPDVSAGVYGVVVLVFGKQT